MKPLNMIKSLNLSALVLSAFFMLGLNSSGFSIKEYVVNTNDTGPGSLRDVIANSNNGDTIIVDVAGVLMLQSQISIPTDIAIIGPGPIHFSINYINVTGGNSAFHPTNSGTLYIEGLGFMNGMNSHAIGTGSGYTGETEVYGCSFENNSNTVINIDNGNISLVACSFIDNTSPNEAGAILFTGVSLKSINCTYYNNDAATNGGAVQVDAGTADFIHNTFYENGVSVAFGKALYQTGGVVKVRNNIFFNDSQSDALIEVSAGTLSSLGGNITNDMSTTGLPVGSDIENISLNAGISVGSIVTDGWGITYFPPANGSDGIDIDQSATNLPLLDARRVWRVMDGGATAEYADAGAVEYSQLTVRQQGLGFNTLDGVYNSIYVPSSIVGKAAFVFELSGTAPFSCPTDATPYNLFADSTILNGFSQSGSKVPGPGASVGLVTPAITSIEVKKSVGNAWNGFVLSGNDAILAGVSVKDYSFSAGVIVETGSSNPAMILGCHIGVNYSGMIEGPNNTGVRVGEFYSARIGAGNYLGHHYQTRRNVISKNNSVQVRVFSGEQSVIKTNFIGLDATGLNRPGGVTPVMSDTGIYISYYSAAMGVLIGGNSFEDRNVIGDQGIGIELESENTKVLNNFIGSNLTGNASSSETQNGTGIQLYGSFCFNNAIGEGDHGNVIVSNNDGIVVNNASQNHVFSNFVGVGGDGVTDLGNTASGITVGGSGATDNKIGRPGEGNVISNNDDGIVLEGSSNHTIVRSNLIGIAADTTIAAGNGFEGIWVNNGSAFNMIGGCNSGEGNIIGHNTSGITFEGTGADNDTVYGNLIGVDHMGNGIGNSFAGIVFTASINNIQVGDVATGCGNEIAFNAKGIVTDGIGNFEVLISGNSFHDNTGIGIDLDDDGQNGTGATGAAFDNDDAQTPLLISAIDCGGTISLGIQLEVNEDVIIEAFRANDGQEGDSLLIHQSVTFTSGVTQFVTFGSLPGGTDIVVTATFDGGGGFKNTSEFSAPVAVTQIIALVPSISEVTVCEYGTAPELTVPSSIGQAVWFSDAGLTQRIEAGDTISVPFGDLNSAGAYNYYVVDSTSGCYGAVSSPVTLTVVPPPTISIAGPDTVCTGQMIQFTTYRPSVFNTIDWMFVPEGSPGQSFYNGIQVYNPSFGNEEVLDGDTYGSFESGTNDTITVSIDSAGCYSSAFKVITVVSAPQPDNDSIGNPTTCGGTDGYLGLGGLVSGSSFTLYHDGGTGDLVTVDANGWGFLNGLGAGTYQLDSLDNGHCVENVFITLSLVDPTPLAIDTIIFNDPTTCGGTGSMQVNLTFPLGADNLVELEYDAGSTGMEYSASELAGISSITATTGIVDGFIVPDVTISAYGCTTTYTGAPLSYTVSDPTPPSATAGTDQNICIGSSATLTGGPVGGAFTYAWDNGGGTGMTASVSPTITTTYTLTVTETATNCIGTDQVDVTVVPLPTADAGANQTSCTDSPTITLAGSITNAGGGQWTTSGSGSFSPSDTDLNADYIPSPGDISGGGVTITLTTTGSGVCSPQNSQMTLTINPIPDEGNPFVTGVTCFGGSDGGIMIAPSGSYTFSWTGPNSFTSVSQDISGLEAGNYNLTMTDAAGCTGTYAGTVNEPSSLPTFAAVGTDLLCNGDASGQLTITALAGVSPFQYSINGGSSYQTTSTYTGLIAQPYTINIMDANGCVSADSTITLAEPLAVVATAAVSSNYNGSEISCAAGSDGELTATAGGGTIPYSSYDWELGGSPVGSGAVLTNVSDGTYDLIVTDNNGCIGTTNITITEPTAISITVSSTSPSCFGGVNGSIEAFPSGGTGSSYTIDWYDDVYVTWVSSDNPFNFAAAGNYYVEATDVNGCVGQYGPETLVEPLPLTVVISTIDETCSGYGDGELDTTSVSGGTMPYSIDWESLPSNNNIGSVAPLTGIVIGDYVGIITDGNGCELRDTVTINAGETYTPLIVYTSNLDSCINNNDFDFFDDNNVPPSGAAIFDWTFDGGVPATSSAQMPTGVSFNAIAAREIVYTVTSNAGCVFDDTIFINIMDTATVVLSPMDASCFGLSDGSIQASASGGTGNYEYSFDGGAFTTNNTFSNLMAGTYTCVVEDVTTGCQSEIHSVGIAEPTQISFIATISDATCGNSNGQVEFQNIAGGAGGYMYSIDGTNYVTSNPITNLAPGTYQYYIQDANGCVEAQNSNTIGNIGTPVPVPSIQEGSPYEVCFDNSNDYGFLSVVSNDVSPGSFDWYLAGNIISVNDTLYLDDFNVGNHYIYVTESNGMCDSPADSVLLDVLINDAVNDGITEFCLGAEVVLDINTSGSITWNDTLGQITDLNSSLTVALPSTVPTVYTFDVTIGGCVFEDSLVLTEDPDCEGIIIDNNAFSPNGDGVNDLFTIDAHALIDNDNTVMILNRWGDVINEYTNYNNFDVAWDGTNTSGEPVPSGTYFYIVEIPDVGLKSTGWIQVVREF